MTPHSQLYVTETLWFGETPFSPQPPDRPGLVCVPVQANRLGEPTIALSALYYVASPHADYYGGLIPSAIWVVAVQLEGGDVYQSDLLLPDQPPIEITISDAEAESATGTWPRHACFNLDLPELLGLPQEASSYRVLLWLDDLRSDVETIELPERPAGGACRLVASKPLDVVHFSGATEGSPPEPGRIELSAGPKSDGTLTVRGRWTPERPAEGDNPPVLWVLATSHRERRHGFVAIHADDLAADAETFEVDVLELVGGSGTEQKIFVLALSPTAQSDVVVLRTE